MGQHPALLRSNGSFVSVPGAEILQRGDTTQKGFKFGLPFRFDARLLSPPHLTSCPLVPPLHQRHQPVDPRPSTLSPGHPPLSLSRNCFQQALCTHGKAAALLVSVCQARPGPRRTSVAGGGFVPSVTQLLLQQVVSAGTLSPSLPAVAPASSCFPPQPLRPHPCLPVHYHVPMATSPSPISHNISRWFEIVRGDPALRAQVETLLLWPSFPSCSKHEKLLQFAIMGGDPADQSAKALGVTHPDPSSFPR